MVRKKLKKWVIDNNFKNSDIAEKLGITKTHWSNIVNGKTNPSFGLCEKFQAIFKVENSLELFEKEN